MTVVQGCGHHHEFRCEIVDEILLRLLVRLALDVLVLVWMVLVVRGHGKVALIHIHGGHNVGFLLGSIRINRNDRELGTPRDSDEMNLKTHETVERRVKCDAHGSDAMLNANVASLIRGSAAELVFIPESTDGAIKRDAQCRDASARRKSRYTCMRCSILCSGHRLTRARAFFFPHHKCTYTDAMRARADQIGPIKSQVGFRVRAGCVFVMLRVYRNAVSFCFELYAWGEGGSIFSDCTAFVK